QRLRGDLGQSDRSNRAGAYEIRQCADAVLDRHVSIDAVQIVKVDPIGAQAAQCLLARALERFRAAVDDALAVHAGHAALARQEEALAKRGEHLADELLIATEAV